MGLWNAKDRLSASGQNGLFDRHVRPEVGQELPIFSAEKSRVFADIIGRSWRRFTAETFSHAHFCNLVRAQPDLRAASRRARCTKQ